MRNRHIKAAVLAALSAANALGAIGAMAADNIVIDNTLNGTERVLGKVGDTYSVTQDLGAVRGANLFHSFLRFNLSAGEIAEFSGSASITNIISRVTGGEASLVDGTIRSTIGGASFWFVNPAGITIGPSGAIDVSGAVALGAADSIDFEDGASFFALPDDDGLAVGLTVASPVDFGFLQNGSLQAAQGRLEIHNADFLSGYSLLAGPTLLSGAGGVSIDVEGDLSVQNMRIRTASSDGLTGSIEINATGAITLANADLMTSMGVDSTGGDIFIQGGELVTISHSSVVAESIEAGVPTGNVSIAGSGVLIRDQSVIATNFLSTAPPIFDPDQDEFEAYLEEIGPGNISILATGNSSETAPQAQLTTATDGVVRIADSAVLVKNVGGRNPADRGGIRIGRIDQFQFFEEDPEEPGEEPDVDPDEPDPDPEPEPEDIFGADHVVIAGSVIATDATGDGAADDILLGGRQGVWITDASISARASETARASGQVSVGAGDAGVNIEGSTLDTSNAVTGDPEFSRESPFDFDDVFFFDIEIFANGRIALDQATLRTDSTGVKSAGDIGLVADTVRVSGGQLTTSVTKLRFSDQPGFFDYSAGDIFVFAANDSGSATPLVIENGAVLRTNSTDNGDPLTDPQGASAGSIELQSPSGSISISNATLESGSNGRNGDAAGKITVRALAIDVADSTFNTAALSQNPNAFTGDNTGDIALDAEAGATRIARSQFTANSTAVGVAGAIRVSGTTVDITDSSFETSSAGGGAAGGIDVVAGGDEFSAADRVLRISNSTFTSSTVSQPTTFGGDIFISSSVGSIEVDRSTFNTAILSGGETEGFDSFLGFPEASISISAGLGFGGLFGSLKITDSVLQSTTSGAINGGSISLSGDSVLLRGSTLAASSDTPMLLPVPSDPTFPPVSPQVGNAGSIGISTNLRLDDGDAGAQDFVPPGLTIDSTTIVTNAVGSRGGDIGINSNAQLLLRNSSLVASAGGAGASGNISITGDMEARLQGTSVVARTESGTAGTVGITLSEGASGPLLIDSSSLATNASNAAGGSIALDAAGNQVVLRDSSIVASAGGTGTGGDVAIRNAAGTTLQGSQLQALADAGNGGTISIDLAAGSVGPILLDNSLITTNANTGNGGSITLNAAANQVTLRSSSLVASASGSGMGGSIAVLDASSATLVDSQVQALAESGTGGTISITQVRGAAAISIDGSSIMSNASNANGGNIAIDAAGGEVLLRDSMIVASAGGTGAGGDISILNAGGATLQNVQIQALANAGAGGNINLSVAPDTGRVVIQKSAITTNAVAAGGGNITLEAGGNQLLLRDSTLLASAGATGTGGNILMNDVGQTIMQRSQVLARADAGNGGAITINLRDGALFVRDAQSTISADSNSGNDGQVAINSPDTDVNPAVKPQDASLASTPELSANACRPAGEAARSTFVRETRGGAAVSPDSYLVSTQPAVDGARTSAVQPAQSAPLQPELRVAMASLETAIATCMEGTAR